MAANECVPYWAGDDGITCHAGSAITGKTLVKLTAATTGDNPTVQKCTAATDIVFGVAAYDAASGTKVTIYINPHWVVPVTVGVADLAALALVVPDANGKLVVAGSGVHAAGIILDAAVAGADAKLYRSVYAVAP